jgi:hypothetical protein
MHRIQKLFLTLATFTVIGLATAVPARADIIFLGQLSEQGQGIGAVNTALTLINNTGATATGAISPAGPAGNAGTGAAQGGLFTFSQLGITGADQFRIVFNINEAGSADTLILNSLILTAFAPTGSGVLGTFDLAADLVGDEFTQIAGGVGGSGLVFGLDPAQTAQLQALFLADPALRLGLAASLGGLNGGNDVFQFAMGGTTAPIPEPTTMLLLGTGLVGIAGYARRRRANQSE